MTDLQATFFATLVDEWVRSGVTDAVVCPGNRSSLLSVLLEQHPRVRVHVMVDERSASFFALGLGLSTGRPAVFWCTSGTAAVEAHAAVVEAHQAQVPLIVATADRPPELHHARDWQSIDQVGLYGATTRWAYDTGVATEAGRDYWRSIASRAVLESMHNALGPGPVHLNLPIREPWTSDPGDLPLGRGEGGPWHSHVRATSGPAPKSVLAAATNARRGLFVVGRTSLVPEVLHRAALNLGWPVIAEARSGSRIPSPTTIAAADSILRSPKFGESHRPELVIRIGTPVLSKVVASWLAGSGAEEWLIGPHDLWQGPAVHASRIVDVDPVALCESLASVDAVSDRSWLDEWASAEALAQGAICSELDGDAVSEPAIARTVTEHAMSANVFAATSMPVRDVESFAAPREGLRVFANRGASGMDGIISTAAGVSVGLDEPVTLLIGDLSFLYDLNALWNVLGADAQVDLSIVLVDNNGGGIFSMLPQLNGLDPDAFERVVATPQNVDLEAVVKAFGIPCVTVSSVEELRQHLEADHSRGLRVLRVVTNRHENREVHARLNNAVVKMIESQ